MLGGSLISTNGKVLGSDEGINLVLFDGEVIGTILGNVDRIILGLDFVTYLGSLDGSNGGMLEGLFIGVSLLSTDGKLIGYS